MGENDGLVSMKLTEADRGTVGRPSIEQPDYPYGLSLRFEKPELKKLGIKQLPQVGDEFEIIARGRVSQVYESQSEGNREDRSIQIQITDLAVK